MPKSGGEHLSVAAALYQLDFYLKTLRLPFSAADLYRTAYKERRGDLYDDSWLETLDEMPDVDGVLEQPFTTHTIVETLMRTGHEAIVRALIREVRKHQITYNQLYLTGLPGRR